MIIAGHLCLDIIPELASGWQMQPGQLSEAGKAVLASGGAVANVGLNLHKLGFKVKLLGQLGDDGFGKLLKDYLSQLAPEAAKGLSILPQVSTSYTIILSSPERDRSFLHHAGANAHYSLDLDRNLLKQAKVFYFGYPPLIASSYIDGGTTLAALFKELKAEGVMTALDMSTPDVSGPAARVDWTEFLATVLPYVDIFMPSLDDLRAIYPQKELNYHDYVLDLSQKLLDLGAALVGITLGEDGIFLSCAKPEGLKGSLLEAWAKGSYYLPAFDSKVIGTTGAGDACFAGMIAAILKGFSLRESLRFASANAACSVQAADAISGVKSFQDTLDLAQSQTFKQGLAVFERYLLPPLHS
ncbi:MAG: carbohydrate kinase family protein [Deinococcales bacterium]